jgi:hypothetical protein
LTATAALPAVHHLAAMTAVAAKAEGELRRQGVEDGFLFGSQGAVEPLGCVGSDFEGRVALGRHRQLPVKPFGRGGGAGLSPVWLLAARFRRGRGEPSLERGLLTGSKAQDLTQAFGVFRRIGALAAPSGGRALPLGRPRLLGKTGSGEGGEGGRGGDADQGLMNLGHRPVSI